MTTQPEAAKKPPVSTATGTSPTGGKPTPLDEPVQPDGGKPTPLDEPTSAR